MLGQLAEAGKACDCDNLRAAEEERLAELEVTTAAVNHRVLVCAVAFSLIAVYRSCAMSFWSCIRPLTHSRSPRPQSAGGTASSVTTFSAADQFSVYERRQRSAHYRVYVTLLQPSCIAELEGRPFLSARVLLPPIMGVWVSNRAVLSCDGIDGSTLSVPTGQLQRVRGWRGARRRIAERPYCNCPAPLFPPTHNHTQ